MSKARKHRKPREHRFTLKHQAWIDRKLEAMTEQEKLHYATDAISEHYGNGRIPKFRRWVLVDIILELAHTHKVPLSIMNKKLKDLAGLRRRGKTISLEFTLEEISSITTKQ